MAITGSFIKRLPLTTTIFYLLVGLVLGPIGFEVIFMNPIGESELLKRVAEIAVIVSLFSAGLKLRRPLSDKVWLIPIKLAFLSMVITVLLITLAAHLNLGLALGASIILGGGNCAY